MLVLLKMMHRSVKLLCLACTLHLVIHILWIIDTLSNNIKKIHNYLEALKCQAAEGNASRWPQILQMWLLKSLTSFIVLPKTTHQTKCHFCDLVAPLHGIWRDFPMRVRWNAVFTTRVPILGPSAPVTLLNIIWRNFTNNKAWVNGLFLCV